MTLANKPDHVPPSLVHNFRWNDLGGETDVYAHWANLHELPDIFYTLEGGGHWIVSRHEDLEYIVNHPEDFSSEHETLPPILSCCRCWNMMARSIWNSATCSPRSLRRRTSAIWRRWPASLPSI